jgi:hypothetical protein
VAKRQRTKKGVTATTPSSPPKQGRSAKTAWKLMDRSTTLAATAAAPLLAGTAWRLVTGRKPPTAGDNPEVELREAIGWAIVGGALVQVVKVGVRRQTAQYWVRSTGQLPPGMKGVRGEIMAREVAEAKALHEAKAGHEAKAVHEAKAGHTARARKKKRRS